MVQSDSIKKKLLKEAENRVSQIKQSSMQKESMGLYAGQGDLLNSNNTTYYTIPMAEGSKIDQIRKKIEESFGHYLRSRLVDPDTNKRSTKLTEISPGVGEELASRKTQVLLDEEILPVNVPGDIDFDNGFMPGHLYYRYGYKRDIVPTKNPEHMRRANGLLSQYHMLTQLNTAQGEIGFIDFARIIRQSNISLLAYFNTRNAGNHPSFIPPSLARGYISSIKEGQPIHVQSPYGNQKELFGNIDLSLLRYVQKEEIKELPYTVGRATTQKVLTFSNDTIDLMDNLEKPSELNRQLFWKICSGFTLDESKLDSTIDEYISEYMKRFPAGTDNVFEKRIRKEWQETKRVMLQVFRTMEKRAPTEFQKAMNSWYRTDAVDDPRDQYLKQDKPPQGVNYQHGMPFYGSSKLLRCYISEGGGETCINFRSIHLKMLLINCTKPNPANYKRCVTYKTPKNTSRDRKEIRTDTYFPLPKADEYIDPRFTVKSYPDGMSDALNATMRNNGIKEIGVPPLIKVPTTDGVEARFDRHNCNLGRHHLTKSGKAVMHLLEWAEETDWPRQAMQALKSAYSQGKMGTTGSDIYRVLSEGTFGSDVFAYTLDTYGDSPDNFLNNHMYKNLQDEEAKIVGTEEESEFEVNQRSLELLKKHGPSISALMDLLYALMHRASIGHVKVKDKNGEPQTITSYGEQYNGSSGAGGGGEVMLSIKFAYEASLEQIGSEQATDLWKKNIPGKDPQFRKKDVLLRNTDPRNIGQEEPMEPLDEGAMVSSIRPHIVERLSFWVGQSSTFRSDQKTGQRRPAMVTLWPVRGFEGKTWSEALEYFYLRYPQVGEDTGEVIFDLGLDLNSLQHRISSGIEKVRQELSLENDILFTTEFGSRVIGGNVSNEEKSTKTQIPDGNVDTTIDTQTNTISEPDVNQPLPQNVQSPTMTAPNTPTPNNVQTVDVENEDKQGQMPKPMYITKKEKKPSLLKHKASDSLIDRIIKVSDTFDKRGYTSVSNKLDQILEKISE